MRISHVCIKGQEYPICFSTRVVISCEERAGGIDAELKKISEENSLKEMFWLLSEMLKAGVRYAKLEGLETPEPPGYEQLIDIVGIDEYQSMFSAVVDATTKGMQRKIEVEEEKNAKTTQEK